MDFESDLLTKIASDFERAWQSGQRPVLSEFLGRVPKDLQTSALQRLLPLDVNYREQAGEVVSIDDYRELCDLLRLEPSVDQSSLVDSAPIDADSFDRLFNQTAIPDGQSMTAPQMEVTGDYSPSRSLSQDSADFGVAQSAAPSPIDPPARLGRIGRFVLLNVLGKGGFGLVYLAKDEQLDRLVAIKVPHATLVSKPEDAQSYLMEARMVANLDHSHIVPVFDVGSTESCPCYVVSKYIEGTDLKTKIQQHRFHYFEAAELVATIAEALHHAHKQGLVHRDVKPGNVLIGKDGLPYVVDFGLALREENVGKGPKYVGTPAYMSPEQARGEGHRVDGRSDVFSLGVVLYELLSGRQPFRSDSRDELLAQVAESDARPLRQYNDRIPKELERICQTAMAKRASERYSTARDFSADLRHFLANKELHQDGMSSTGGRSSVRSNQDSARSSSDVSGLAGSANTSSKSLNLVDSDNQRFRIVPKGLRSFDAHDANFFLELLPGPRDREGLPDSLRFWKTMIEETDPDQTFTVGLIYGPSGCGKSSLVKAGLLPRLSDAVIAIHIEATPEDTESRLLNGLRKKCPALDDKLGLKETLAALRRGQGIPVGQKVLIVLDQFEQWLHAKKEEDNTELVQALRQCDGGRVQCIAMLRDDFWMAATRFLSDLEVELSQGRNFAPVDLFPIRHAEKVLAAFGQAFGVLPVEFDELSKEHKSFITQAVAGLAENAKVISVRLALFAEMMKDKSWTPTTLNEVGGAKGVGITFLESTFNTPTNPRYKLHQQAARAVLAALLPDSGLDIKGCMRSSTELLEASGYAKRPKEFADLMRILDTEIRLITPTDPAGIESDEERSKKSATQRVADRSAQFYQLTHDYLVHSLRDWLTRKQRETKKGRAELKLAERAETWGANPENKQLPTLWEWLTIHRRTEKSKWRPTERLMMARSNRYHTTRSLAATIMVAVLAVAALGWKSWNDGVQRERDATNLVAAIEGADYGKLPDLIRLSDRIRSTVDPKLKLALERHTLQSPERLKLSLALLPNDPTQLDYLLSRLLSAEANQVSLVVGQLAPHAPTIEAKLWETAKQHDPETLLQAASALALYAPNHSDWTLIAGPIADQVVRENPLRVADWMEALQPVAKSLNPELLRIYSATAPERPQSEIDLATEILASYAADDFQILHESVLIGQVPQFRKMFANYQRFSDKAVPALREELEKPAVAQDVKLPMDQQDRFRQESLARRANAAVALLRLEDLAPIYEFLKVNQDPEALSQFVYRLRGREVNPMLLIEGLRDLMTIPLPVEPADRQQHYIRIYGFVLALGEFKLEQLPAEHRDNLIAQLVEMYGSHPSRAVHSSVGWLLRRWGQDEAVRKVDQTPLDYDLRGVREWYVLKIDPPRKSVDLDREGTEGLDANADKGAATEIPSQAKPVIDLSAPIYFTMIVFPDGEFDLVDMNDAKITHLIKVIGPIAVSDRELTWQQFSALDNDLHRKNWTLQFSEQLGGRELLPDEPVFGVNWYEAINYCRWLSEAAGYEEELQSYEQIEFPPGTDNGGMLTLPITTEWPARPFRPGFRLMSDKEWEYVARSGTKTAYSFGNSDSLLSEYGWFTGNSSNWSQRVGMLRPSLGGLFDIHGNVWEWTYDSIGDEPTSRVLRGGGWGFEATYCRATSRNHVGRGVRNFFSGFRVAVNLPAPDPDPIVPPADRD